MYQNVPDISTANFTGTTENSLIGLILSLGFNYFKTTYDGNPFLPETTRTVYIPKFTENNYKGFIIGNLMSPEDLNRALERLGFREDTATGELQLKAEVRFWTAAEKTYNDFSTVKVGESDDKIPVAKYLLYLKNKELVDFPHFFCDNDTKYSVSIASPHIHNAKNYYYESIDSLSKVINKFRQGKFKFVAGNSVRKSYWVRDFSKGAYQALFNLQHLADEGLVRR